MKYVPALDGLRAVAIIPVLAFHAAPSFLPGGFTGVDVFFVISGYLITAVILQEIREGKFSMTQFYLRRALRLLPNALCMISATVVLTSLMQMPFLSRKVAEHGIWTLCNLSNVFIWRSVGGYWGDSANALPLLHTWSLAVEEQFYLVIPAGLWLLSRRRDSIAVIAIFLTLISFAAGVYGSFHHPIPTFYLLPTRAWELLVGTIIAAYPMRGPEDRARLSTRHARAQEVIGIIGLLLIVGSCVFIKEGMAFPGWVALLPTLGAVAVVTTIIRADTFASRLLSVPTVVFIGKLSYSLYLWHWPLIVLGKNYAVSLGYPQQTGAMVGLGLGLIAAVMAYYFVEQPLRLRGTDFRWRTRLSVLAGGFGVTVVLLLAGLGASSLSQNPFDRPVTQTLQYGVNGKDRAAAVLHEAIAARVADVDFTPSDPQNIEAWKTGGIVHEWGNTPPRVLVLGSSHAMMFGRLIDEICHEHGISVAFLAANGQGVFFPTGAGYAFSEEDARNFDEARRQFLRKWSPQVVLIIDRHDGADLEWYRQQLAEMVHELEPHTQRMMFFTQVPALPFLDGQNLREFVGSRLRLTGSLPKFRPNENDPYRLAAIEMLEKLEREHPKVQVLHVDQPFLVDGKWINYVSGRTFYYYDNSHLSEAGCDLAREIVTRAIVDACSPVP